MLWWNMPAYVWVTAASAVAFVALVAFGRHWWHSLWYSWRHAAHVLEETAAEYGPGTFYGSAILGEELTWHNSSPLTIELDGVPDWLPAPPVDPEPWRAQMKAELSPEALDDDEPLSPPPSSHPVWRNPRLNDPGPGDAAVEPPASSGPDQPSRWLAEQLEILRAWAERQQAYAEILA